MPVWIFRSRTASLGVSCAVRTHREALATAAACSDRIFAIRDGIPAFSGTPQEAVNPEVLQRVYGTAFSTVSAPGRSLPYIAAEGRS